jgi:hypothetical protein
MAIAEKLTSTDLELLPQDGKRYELIKGELYVFRQPMLGFSCRIAALFFRRSSLPGQKRS